MRIPAMRGIIDRRILVNYRVDPEVMMRVLPPPFTPQTVNGYAIGGICLIRLKALRPRYLPAKWGLTTENAAHRIAVHWGQSGEIRSGVYIPRRDTNSSLAALAGGRLFPGKHHQANFEVEEDEETLRVDLRSLDGKVRVGVKGRTERTWPEASVFPSVEEASQFFEKDAVGYSDTSRSGRYDGLELRCQSWSVTPLEIEEVSSSFFEDRTRFPEGSVTFDNALLMRGIDHEWRSRNPLCCEDSNDRIVAASNLSDTGKS